RRSRPPTSSPPSHPPSSPTSPPSSGCSPRATRPSAGPSSVSTPTRASAAPLLPPARRAALRPLLLGAGVAYRLGSAAGWLGRYVWSGWAGLAGLFTIAAVWQFGHELYGSFILPSPADTFFTAWALIASPQFPQIAATTDERALTGFTLAAVIGTLAGVVAGY